MKGPEVCAVTHLPSLAHVSLGLNRVTGSSRSPRGQVENSNDSRTFHYSMCLVLCPVLGAGEMETKPYV